MESGTHQTMSTDETWSTRASTSNTHSIQRHRKHQKYNLVMHQMMPHPREEGSEAINQLALTFGTLLSSQRSNAHPTKGLSTLLGAT